MPFSWIRSESVEFPKIYSEFQVQDHEDEEVITLVIQDLETSSFDEVIEIMKDKHILEEPMYSSKGVRDCPVSLGEMIGNWRNMLNQKVSLVCYKKDDDNKSIIAVNVMGVINETEFDSPHNYKGEGWAEVNNVKKFIKNIFFNPFEYYQVENLMFAAGLYVNENYRNRGIAVEMIKVREKVGKTVGVEACSNVFSSLGAQKAAKKAGFEENFSIKYSNLAKLTPDGFFPNIRDEYMKIMSKKFVKA